MQRAREHAKRYHRDAQQNALCEGCWACYLVFSANKMQGKKEMEGKPMYLKEGKRHIGLIA